MADTEYKINLILEAQNKASTEIQKVSWQITGMQDALARIWISAIAISAVKKASSAIIELAWNLEQAEVAFSTMLWSEEKATQMLNELSDFAKNEPFSIAITPEATRKPVKRWKRGFWEIACRAGVPIVPTYIDFSKKEIGAFDTIWPTDDYEADLLRIRSSWNWLGCREIRLVNK